ncbi:MAG TPA: hypothetical protein VID30_05910 [Bradyrhizobium sp.]|jgi:hypothetical protein
MKSWRFKSETPRLFHAKPFVPRMWIDTQFFILEVAREALKNRNERADVSIRLEKARPRFRDLAFV